MRSKFTQNERLIISIACGAALAFLIPAANDATGTDKGTWYTALAFIVVLVAAWHVYKMLSFQIIANRQRQHLLFEENHRATMKYLDGGSG